MSTERHAAYNEALQRIQLAHKIGSGVLKLINSLPIAHSEA